MPPSIRCKNLFELELSLLLKPKKYKHFSRGSKVGNTLLTRLRVGRSTLPSHLYSIGLIDSPQCQCGHKDCNISHFILDCPLYNIERQTLFDVFNKYVNDFNNKTRQNKLDILLYGKNLNNDTFSYENYILTIAMQNFIIQTNRFK